MIPASFWRQKSGSRYYFTTSFVVVVVFFSFLNKCTVIAK